MCPREKRDILGLGEIEKIDFRFIITCNNNITSLFLIISIIYLLEMLSLNLVTIGLQNLILWKHYLYPNYIVSIVSFSSSYFFGTNERKVYKILIFGLC